MFWAFDACWECRAVGRVEICHILRIIHESEFFTVKPDFCAQIEFFHRMTMIFLHKSNFLCILHISAPANMVFPYKSKQLMLHFPLQEPF